MKKAIVIKNEQHSLLPDQEKCLDGMEYQFLDIPAAGLTISEILHSASKIIREYPDHAIIFLSPIPALIKFLCQEQVSVLVFHNDNREAKEINGRVIHVVAREGWVLV